MPRTAKQDAGRLSAISDARAKHKDALRVANEKVKEFVLEETRPYYNDLIDAVRLALIDGHSARQIGMAYGSSDPATIRKLIDDASVNSQEVTPKASWRSELHPNGSLVVRVIAFGEDKQTGEATFTIDEDGENITVTDGDLWLQSVLYREGIVKEVINNAR